MVAIPKQARAIWILEFVSGVQISIKSCLKFPENQVQPFTLPSPDGETLYAWHILPLALYANHESALLAQSTGLAAENMTETLAIKLLAQDTEARLVINCPFPLPSPCQNSPRKSNTDCQQKSTATPAPSSKATALTPTAPFPPPPPQKSTS